MEPIHQFNSILHSFNIKANCVNYQQLENYFYFDVQLQDSTKVKDLQKIVDEISLSLKTPGKPNINILHEQGIVRLEFISHRKNVLKLFDMFSTTPVPKGTINCVLGQKVDGSPMFMDIAQNPHMIVAGTTGSGKSVLLHNIIANVSNYNSAMFLVDPKNVEFSTYEKNKLPKSSVYYSYDDTLMILDYLISTMESRFKLMFEEYDISSLPYMVLIIDEFADLIMQDKNDAFYTKLCRLAQKCRAARISIILATQRPSVNIINGTIKANFPARIACRTASHIDSKIILDSVGAENLMGKGDALLRDNFRFLERFQVAYTDANEVCKNFYS